MATPSIYIRPATKDDSDAFSRIKLSNSELGSSAERLLDYEDLPGAVFSSLYVNLPHSFAFALVDKAEGKEEEEEGYIVGATDTRAFEAAAERKWWPRWRKKYPLPSKEELAKLKEGDQEYVKEIHNPSLADPACIRVAPAHLHIHILPPHQGKGWGRKMVGTARRHLKENGINAVYLGYGDTMEGAAKFYEKLGFRKVEGVNMDIMEGVTFVVIDTD